MNTIAMLDGSLRTIELGTLDAIELCARTVEHDPIVWNPQAFNGPEGYYVTRYAPKNAKIAYLESQSDDESIAQDARENLECLMYETSNAMYELGYYAEWYGGWFHIETIDEGEAE